ncbi:hypothetical protein KC345_g9794 [Hortaea werneckii]|nr:hypothetical protein KC345_g9794 [Hortaea werneckii]
MAEAIIRAVTGNGTYTAGQISVADIHEERTAFLKAAYGVKAASPSQEAELAGAELIVIAVRPQDDLAGVGTVISRYAPSSAAILSIVAGVTISRLGGFVGAERPIIRVIPNTLTDTGLGYSGAALNAFARKEQADAFLNGFGKVLYLEEPLIDIFTGYGVAGPNYVYYFIESLADAGVLAGLPREQAWKVALENVEGAVAMLRHTGQHPRQLLDINNSPGGVGIHALYELNNSDFAAGLQRSVKAAVKRTTELGQAIQVFTDNGLAASYGGSHKLWGTHNALSYFGLNYIEFLAIENRELAEHSDTANLVVKDAVRLLPDHEGFSRVAIRTDNIEETASALQKQGLKLSPVLDGKRLNAQGQWIEWRMLTIGGDFEGLVYPFVIEWKGNDAWREEELTTAGIIVPHPAGTVTVRQAVFSVPDPVAAAAHWGEIFGLAEVQDSLSIPPGDSVSLAIGDKVFEFRRGEDRQMKQLILTADAPGLPGRTLTFARSDAFRFPVFSTAMSTAVLNRELDKILLIQQYNRKEYILLAGYVNKGENAEAALVREVKEEAGLEIIAYEYMRSQYFAPSNTLMLNFISVADTEDLSAMSGELDHAAWFTLDEAADAIWKGSLAESFLLTILEKLRQGRTLKSLTAVAR